MSDMQEVVRGAGGAMGGSGSGGKQHEDANSLISNSFGVIMDILSEGPIKGLYDPHPIAGKPTSLNSVRFNDTPLVSEAGDYNFAGANVIVMQGLPNQVPITGLPQNDLADPGYDTQVGVVVNRHINGDLAQALASPILRTVADNDASGIRITLQWASLIHSYNKGQDIRGASVNFQIETRIGIAAPWYIALTDTVSGKTNSPYQREYRLDRPKGTGDWQVRITRLTEDDGITSAATSQSQMTWVRYTVIYDNLLSYPDTAYAVSTFNASYFGSSVPSRKFRLLGKMVVLPVNYDPYARTYTGLWNGTFKLEWTNNPAWIFYDLITNKRFGCGEVVDGSTVDKWALYSIGQYCDQVVPSGNVNSDGSVVYEPRFTFNGVLDRAEDGIKVLQQIASMFDSIVYASSSTLTLVQDAPQQPVKLFTAANVVNGEFSYEGTSLATRPTSVRVIFIDPENNFAPAVEVVEDAALIAKWGRISQDIQMIGCTSRGQAARKGANVIDVSWTSSEVVSFSVGLDHADITPGQIIALADPNYQQARLGGRFAANCTRQIVRLDAPVPLDATYLDDVGHPQPVTYQLLVTYPDGTVDVRNVVNQLGVTVDSLYLDQPLAQDVTAGAVWILAGTNAEPRPFRVLTAAEKNTTTFEVKAVFFDQARRDRVELGIKRKPPRFSKYKNAGDNIEPPSNVQVRDYLVGVGTTTIIRATVSWTPSSDERVTTYDVRAIDSGGVQTFYSSKTISYDIDGLAIGLYRFSVRSVTPTGTVSAWVDAAAAVNVDGRQDAPAAPMGLTAQGGALRVALSWSPVGIRDLLHYEVWRAPAPGNGSHPANMDAWPLAPGTDPTQANGTLLTFVDGTAFTDASELIKPDTVWAYWVRATTTTGTLGLFAGPVKALTTYYLTDNLEDAIKNTAIFAQALLGGAPTNVTDLHVPGTKEGQLVFNQTDKKLYSWDATHQVWVQFIPLIPDSTGKLTAAQVGALNNVQIQGTLTPEQNAALLAGIAAGTISSDKIASLVGTKVTGAITNATMMAGQIYDVDPVTQQQVVGISTAKLLGNLNATKIFDVDSAGNVIPGVSVNKIVGKLPTSQLTGNILASSTAILDLQSTAISGVLQAARIAALDTLNGKITTTQITDGAVTSPLIEASAVKAKLVGAYQIDAGNIAAGAITTAALAVGSTNNAIANSCFAYSADGWAGLLPVPVIGTADELNYSLGGLGAGRFNAGYLAPGATTDCYFNGGNTGTGRAFDGSVPASPGECWEAQATFIPYGGSLQVHIVGVNASGGISGNGSLPTTFIPPSDGKTLDKWQTIGARLVLPAGTVAVLLLLRFSNPASVSGTIGSFVTRCLLGKTVPNATALLPWTPGGATSITGGLIRTNTIVARNLVADSITTRELAVGAVTAENIAIASSTNVVWNPSCGLGTDGWSCFGSGFPSMGYGFVPHTLQGEGTGYVHSSTVPAGQGIYAAWTPVAGTPGVPVEPGNWIEAQARLCAFRCLGYVQIQFFDGTGAVLTSNSILGSSVAAFQGGSSQLSGYALTWVKGQVPAGAATARLLIVGYNDGAQGGNDAYVFFTRAQIGASTPVPQAQSQPQAWVPGGVTQISGGMLQTGTVVARTIAANAITTQKLAVGNSNNLISNSCLAVSTEGWAIYAGNGMSAALSSCAAGHTDYATPDGCGVLDHATSAGNQYTDIYWQMIACAGGDTIEAQVMVLPIAVNASIYLAFFAPDGSFVGNSPVSGVLGGQAVPVQAMRGGLAAFNRLQMIAAAPPNAAQVRFVLRLTSPGDGSAAGYTVFTRAMLGQTVPGATEVSSWAPGGITSISGGVIKTGTLVARTIAAGAITAEKLSIGSASNVIWNSTCPSTSAGWLNASSIPSTLGSVTGDAIAPAAYALSGLGSGCITAAGNLAGANAQGLFVVWDPDNTSGVPAQAGDWWETSALLGAHRCWARVRIQFLDYLGTVYGEVQGNRVAGNIGGTEQAQYGFSWCNGQAPAGTTRARMIIDGLNDGGADIAGSPGINPYVFFTKCVLGPSVPNATQPQPWQPGGVTQISGGMIKTGAIVTKTLAAGAITAEKLSIGSASNVIINPCCSINAIGWSGGVQALQPGDAHALIGYGSGYASLASQAADTYADYSWAPNGPAYSTAEGQIAWGAAVPATPGQLWEAQMLVQTLRCSVELYVLFMGIVNGAWTLVGAISTGAQAFGGLDYGRAEGNYNQLTIKGTAPANTLLVTLMFRMGNTAASRAVHGAASGQSPVVYFTKAALGLGLPNVGRMPWGPGGRVSIDGGEIKAASIQTLQLAAGSVVAGTIAAGSVTTGALAASSVTAEKLTIGSPSNLIWNGCCDQGTYGWYLGTAGGIGPAGPAPNVMGSASSTNPLYGITGFGSGFAQRTDAGLIYSNQGYFFDWAPTAGITGLPARTGATYGAAALLYAGNGMTAFIQIIFLDYNQNIVKVESSASVTASPNGNGLVEDFYTRVTLLSVAPLGTAFVLLRVFGLGAGPGAYQPFFSFSKAMIGEMPDGSTVVGPWVPGGVTTINGNMIKTGSLDASRITAGTITAGQIAARSLTAETLAANSVSAYNLQAYTITGDRIAANTIVGGNIQAAAIGADQIAANQIHAKHLASEQLLTSSAQIGVATIEAANIMDLIVNGEKITPAAVSTIGFGSNVFNVAISPTSWSALTPCYLEKRRGSSAVVIHLKAICDFYAYLDPYGAGGSDGGGGLGV